MSDRMAAYAGGGVVSNGADSHTRVRVTVAVLCRRHAAIAQRPLGVVRAAQWPGNHRGSVARSDAETVAESSAFVVLSHFGIDAGAYTFPYVAHWAQDMAVLRRNLTEVQGVAAGLIAGIEAATLAE